MAGRVIAIGDIHGCLAAFDALLGAIDLQKDDSLILLGDYVDRGPNSAGVLGRIIELKEKCFLFPILGNHDELMLKVIKGETWDIGKWLMYGGQQTMASYGTDAIDKIPQSHAEFLAGCISYCETQHHFFTHANYLEDKLLAKTPSSVLRWESLNARMPLPHKSRKIAVLGHTAQKSGEIFYNGYLLCIDTFCYGTGFLTAFDVETGDFWQSPQSGEHVKTGRFRGQKPV